MTASSSNVDHHLFVNVRVADHGTELVERDSTVFVFVGEQDGFVDDLLQLRVLQVVAHHHFEHHEKFIVRNVTVVVHVVNAKRKLQFGLFVSFHAELRHPLNEL